MKADYFWGLLMAVVAASFGFSSTSNAGGGTSAPTLEGGPTYVGSGTAPSAKLQGTPVPAPNNNMSSLPDAGGNSQSQTVPGAGSYDAGNNLPAATGVTERGVAGSGLPREKISTVETKSLPASKTDGKFSSSLMDIGLKSGADAKTSSTTDKKTAAKTQTTADKSSKAQSPSTSSMTAKK